MSRDAAELMDRGIGAYTRGDVGEARRCWTELLAADPQNARARAYLAILEAHAGALVTTEHAAPVTARGAPHRADPGAPSPWDQGPAAAPAVVLGEGEGLDLASVAHAADAPAAVPGRGGTQPPPRRSPEVDAWMKGARERFEFGDFSGSLELVEQVLWVEPSHEEARSYLRRNESILMSMYESKLGPTSAKPRLAIRPEEVMWLNLEHRAGFLLAQIDGTVSYDDLFALSGVPRLDTARILVSLLEDGVITS